MNNDDDFLMLYNILKFVNYTGIGNRPSKRKKFFTMELPKKVSEIQNIKFDENTDDSDNLQGEGVKTFVPSIIIDIYTRLEVLLGLKLSGYTDTLTEASNLVDKLYKRGEIQNKEPYRNALNKFSTQQMELRTKLLKQIAFNTRPKIEEHLLISMDNSTIEVQLSQLLQTNNKKFKKAVTFLTGYNGIFNVTNRNNRFSFKKNLINEDFIQIRTPEGAYESESLDNESKRIIIDKEYYTESDYPFKMKPKLSTLGSIITILPQGPIIVLCSTIVLVLFQYLTRL